MNTTDNDQNGKEEQVLEALFKHVSSRERAPQATEQDIRQALHGEWTQMSGQRKRAKKVLRWALAASIVLTLLVSSQYFRQPVSGLSGSVLATLEKLTGDVYVQQSDTHTAESFDSQSLLSGHELYTSNDSRVALSWVNGESIRLDQNSRIVLISPAEIKLLSGKVYVDSANARVKGREFRIMTPSGAVSHVGTQYITAITVSGIAVSVREGEVFIDGRGEKSVATVGQELSVTVDGALSLTPIPIYGQDWQWTQEVAPKFNMDGHSLKEFIAWVGRETGHRVKYTSLASEIAAAQTQMHGNVDRDPLRAMELMLQSSDLTPKLKDGVILVSD